MLGLGLGLGFGLGFGLGLGSLHGNPAYLAEHLLRVKCRPELVGRPDVELGQRSREALRLRGAG